MNHLKSLKEKRAQIDSQLDAIKSACETEKRSRTADEKTKWTQLEQERSELDEEIKAFEEQEKRNKEQVQNLPPVNNDTQTESRDGQNLANKFSIFRGLSLMAQGKPLDGAEKEVADIGVEQARTAGVTVSGFTVPAFIESRGQSATGQTTNPGDQGGLTVATELNSLIEALWAQNWLSAVGATRLVGLIGNQKFPVQSTKPAASELTEIEQMTDTEILFDDVDMSPNRRGVTIPVSKQVMIQSSLDIQKLVMDNMRMALDYKLNVDSITALLAAITSGNGNLVAIGTNGGAPTYDHMVDLETAVSVLEGMAVNMKYLTNGKVRGKLKKTQEFSSTNGEPVWKKDNTLNGYQAVVSNIIPSNLTKGTSSGVCSAIVFGNFKDLYVGIWGGMDFVVDPYSAKRKGQVEITVNSFWDTEVARAASFSGIKDATTT